MAGIMLQRRGLLGMQGIKNLSGRRDECTKLQKEQSEKFAAMAGELRAIRATLPGARTELMAR